MAGRTKDAGPLCGFVWDDAVCKKRGDHMCEPRVAKVVGFIENICVHTKSVFARKPFILEDWQRDEIVRPVFGTVRYSDQWGCYIRRYTLAHIELGRGNGKSELAAALVLYLLVADGEESAEVYGAAKTTKQAGKVGEVVKRMMELSPLLSKRLSYHKQARRLSDFKTNSYYEVIPGDAEGELGHNAYGVVIDEFLTQADPELFDALRTAQGKRPQSLIICFTTAGQTDGFAYDQHKEMQKIADDPNRAPHIFVYLRNVPIDADPWDESLWYLANPALGKFLSLDTLRNEAKEAQNDPVKEVAFRQFRLNQWVANTSIWMQMTTFDPCAGQIWDDPEALRASLAGRVAWGGLDIASKLDLCAWCLLVLPTNENEPIDVVWRFWIPERPIKELDLATTGKFSQWIQDGWVTVSGDNVLNFETVYADIEKDAQTFEILGFDVDEFASWPVIERVMASTMLTDEEISAYKNTYERMSPGLEGVMGLAQDKRWAHHANPVARWCVENTEVRFSPMHPELIRVEKPERNKTGKRVDAVPAWAMAMNAWDLRGSREIPTSAYEDHDLLIV